MKNKIFVVSLIYEGEKLYFVRSNNKPFLEGNILMSEPEGIFHTDLMKAKKFREKIEAELCASYFEGAGVEVITTGEHLK